jgi:hypothetical protein
MSMDRRGRETGNWCRLTLRPFDTEHGDETSFIGNEGESEGEQGKDESERDIYVVVRGLLLFSVAYLSRYVRWGLWRHEPR